MRAFVRFGGFADDFCVLLQKQRSVDVLDSQCNSYSCGGMDVQQTAALTKGEAMTFATCRTMTTAIVTVTVTSAMATFKKFLHSSSNGTCLEPPLFPLLLEVEMSPIHPRAAASAGKVTNG